MRPKIFFALCVGLSCQPALAADFSCPEIKGNLLASVEVYDGPFSDNAILAPDTFKETKTNSSSTWGVAYVYEAGRQLNVVCRYKDKKKTEEIRSISKLMSCELKTSTKTGSSFACK